MRCYKRYGILRVGLSMDINREILEKKKMNGRIRKSRWKDKNIEERTKINRGEFKK